MKYLINTTETYRVSTEEEATSLINDAKNEANYVLLKYSTQYKEKKSKGEVIDFYWKVILVKEFTSEKEPERDINVEYKENSAF